MKHCFEGISIVREQVKEIVEDNPKLFSQIIKKDEKLYTWVINHPGETISEKIYNSMHCGVVRVCPAGNKYKFRSINDGYKFCGRANVCQCNKNSVTEKAIKAKKSITREEQSRINIKREKTNVSRYGVTNVGQTTAAIEKHREFYSDDNAVDEVSKKIRTTKIEKYGDPNYNNKEQIRKTCLNKYGVHNTFLLTDDNQNPMLIYLQNKDRLSTLYKENSIPDIASKLNVHIQTVYRYLNMHRLRQPFKSSEEKEVVDYIKSLGITNIVCNSRKILESKKEIDIFLPDYNIAIEYNGVYWHHEDVSHITKHYHADKVKECEKLGIHLITIFSTFWKSKRHAVEQLLKSKLQLHRKAIYARKCKVINVDNKIAREFLNKNHVQGYTPSQIAYGLSYDDTFVAIMTFSKARTGIGKARPDTWELVRFATNTRVTGAAGKLLKHFERNTTAKEIISYSDNEWSQGNVYSVLGFELEKESKPSYWYIRPREEKMYHRYTFAKHKLVEQGHDTNKTEREITKQMGLLKLWDCGKKTWVKQVSSD